MTLLFTNCEQTLSCRESRNDDLLGNWASGGDSTKTDASEVAVRADDLLDETEVAQRFR